MFGVEQWLDVRVHFFPGWANILESKLCFEVESGLHSLLLCDLTLDQSYTNVCHNLIWTVEQC